MTRDEWLQQCEDKLLNLRPHLSSKFATTIALQLYSEKEHLRVAAREYDARQKPRPAPVAKKAKR